MPAAQSRLRIAEGMNLSYYGPPSALKGQQCYLKLFPILINCQSSRSQRNGDPLCSSLRDPLPQRFEFRYTWELLALNTKMFALSQFSSTLTLMFSPNSCFLRNFPIQRLRKDQSTIRSVSCGGQDCTFSNNVLRRTNLSPSKPIRRSKEQVAPLCVERFTPSPGLKLNLVHASVDDKFHAMAPGAFCEGFVEMLAVNDPPLRI